MKSVLLQEAPGLEAVTVTETEAPIPGPGEVLVRVRAVSLNYRDLLVAKGHYGKSNFHPIIPCSDGAGEVVAVGPGVTEWKIGDRVAGIFMQRWLAGPYDFGYGSSALGAGTCNGVLAQERVFAVSGLVRIPEYLSFEEAATLPCAAVTAWNALFESGSAKPGDTVLLQGTGGVSIFGLQLAKAAGLAVIITSSSDAKLERAKALGADHLINYKSTEAWDDAARKLTGRRGVDQILEVGGSATLNRSMSAVRAGGTISVIGVLSGTSGEVGVSAILGKSLRLQGIYVGSRAMFEALNRSLAMSRIVPVIDRVFPLEEARNAYRYMESGAHFGKVVIRLD